MEQSRKGMVTRNMKKIRLLLCAMATLLCMTGCTIMPEKAPVDADKAQMAESISYMIISQLYAQTAVEENKEMLLNVQPEEFEKQFESMGAYIDGSALVAGINSWLKASEELGELADITNVTAEHDSKGTSIIVNLDITGTKTIDENGTPRTAIAEFIFDDDYYLKMTSATTNVNYSLGEKMGKAGLNTLIGMGTVFSVLILLCIIISLFKYISVFENMLAKKNEKPSSAPVDQAIAQIIKTEEQADDGELVAVIAAAIAAYESANGNAVSASDFVVRSIKRRSDNKWNKA